VKLKRRCRRRRRTSPIECATHQRANPFLPTCPTIMAKLIHTMIRVRDLDASLKFYREVLDLTPAHQLDFPDFGLVYLRNADNDVELELTWNKGRTEPYTHGDGYGHIAVVEEDVARRHAELVEAGYAPLPVKEFKDGDALIARFFFIQDPDGYKIEVLERHGHYR
jgi:lactoylglutathione lyase